MKGIRQYGLQNMIINQIQKNANDVHNPAYEKYGLSLNIKVI